MAVGSSPPCRVVVGDPDRAHPAAVRRAADGSGAGGVAAPVSRPADADERRRRRPRRRRSRRRRRGSDAAASAQRASTSSRSSACPSDSTMRARTRVLAHLLDRRRELVARARPSARRSRERPGRAAAPTRGARGARSRPTTTVTTSAATAARSARAAVLIGSCVQPTPGGYAAVVVRRRAGSCRSPCRCAARVPARLRSESSVSSARSSARPLDIVTADRRRRADGVAISKREPAVEALRAPRGSSRAGSGRTRRRRPSS